MAKQIKDSQVSEKVELKSITRLDWFLNTIHKIKPTKIVEQLLDPDTQLEQFRTKKLDLVNNQILYKHGTEKNEKLIRLYGESRISNCNDTETTSLPLMTKQTNFKLLEKHYSLFHLGLILIGIKGLHRKELGTRVFVAIVDARNNDIIQAIIGSLEIDMAQNSQIAFALPDCIVPLKDFHHNFKLVIKTKGYNMISNSENLLICHGVVGKVTTTSEIRYTIEEINIVEYLASKGVKIIPAEKVVCAKSQEWKLDDIIEKPIETPSRNSFYINSDGSISLRFTNYNKTKEVEDETLEI